MTAIIKLIGALIVGAFGSIIGNEIHNTTPQLTKRLIQLAATWYPENERQDFIDENTDIFEGYADEGRHVTALTRATLQLGHSAINQRIPSYLQSEQSIHLGTQLVFGLVYGLVLGLNFGLMSLPAPQPVIWLVFVLGFGLVYGLAVSSFAITGGLLAPALGSKIMRALRYRLSERNLQ